MLGTIILPLVVIFGSVDAAELELQDVHPGYERNYSAFCEGQVTPVPSLLPCIPNACVPTFCELGEVKADGSLYCDDSDEVYPAGHWMPNDWQEDEASNNSVHYLTEY